MCIYAIVWMCEYSIYWMCIYTSRRVHAAAISFINYPHILRCFLHPQAGNHAFGSSNRVSWLIWMFGFGGVTSIIANDVANELNDRINELRRIESRKVLENLYSQSRNWMTDLIVNVCKHRQMLFGRTLLEVDSLNKHQIFDIILTVSMSMM